ncbi:MAG TPA: phospholipid carrier-dependent glycosyltransferase, partial [Candidatus Baltobacteraceae bacterium]
MNTSKAELRNAVCAQEPTLAVGLWLGLIIAAGFVIRLLFIGNQGFSTDIGTFEAWATTLIQHPLSQFYTSTSFADYPPGYFYVLWLVGHVYALLAPHGNYALFADLVKLPAILMDLVDGALIYAIVRRFAGERWALGAAALFVLNPSTIFVSAAYGQVDSIPAGFVLLGIYLLLKSDDAPSPVVPIAVAWVALCYSLLIKPQAAVLIPLFVVFAFVNKERRQARVAGTAAGIVAALIFAFLLTVPFHPSANPIAVYGFLLAKYTYASGVYAVNSVNAFNLWSILHGFWDRDSQTILFVPQYIWGIVLVLAAVILTLVRYWQAKTAQALLESAALLTLAFFMLATRMHERYIYDGVTLTIACIPFARRYLWAAVAFSATLFVNLLYTLQYLHAASNPQPGVNTMDLWPAVTHPLSLLNVAVFFALGYLFLGTDNETASAPAPAPAKTTAPFFAAFANVRPWFNPREGLASMVWPLDYLLAGSFGVISFVVSYVNYWLPNEKIFDEIYFARAAEEYLSGKYIYENTHPPLTKLIITLSTMLFGGLPHGDNPAGWRFLDVVFGAIAVVVIYAFAKRLTRSKLFASFAAIMLTADGMHFVQSRIATPEGIVVVFSLGALYAFYRFWIASQATVRRHEPRTMLRSGVSLVGAIVLGCISGFLAVRFGNPPGTTPLPDWINPVSFAVTSAYFASGWYLLMRLVVVPRLFPPHGEFVSYADGTRILRHGDQEIETPYNRPFKKDLTIREAQASITYRRDGTVSYATPEGSATYSPDGTLSDDDGETENGKHATTWLIVFTVLLGALVASKWYGVMAYGVSFIVIAFVWLQRLWAEGRAKRWGNPYGFRLDVALATIVFVSMSVYVCAWIPELVRHVQPPGDTGAANVGELVYRQYTMFEYHDKLVATHPYSSEWWQWPLDLRPIAYYWKDLRTGVNTNNPNACCVAEITSLPNPIILWLGLLCVPLVAILAYLEKNKGYALLVLAYLLQWLPWARSPRITFAYHFYV